MRTDYSPISIFNGGLFELPLDLEHWWVISSQCKSRTWLLIHAKISGTKLWLKQHRARRAGNSCEELHQTWFGGISFFRFLRLWLHWFDSRISSADFNQSWVPQIATQRDIGDQLSSLKAPLCGDDVGRQEDLIYFVVARQIFRNDLQFVPWPVGTNLLCLIFVWSYQGSVNN